MFDTTNDQNGLKITDLHTQSLRATTNSLVVRFVVLSRTRLPNQRIFSYTPQHSAQLVHTTFFCVFAIDASLELTARDGHN